MKNYFFMAVFFLSFSSLASSDIDTQSRRISEVLDSFHQAAAAADGVTYFYLLTDDAIFLGTDASERWTKSEFKRYASPFFSQGKGWLYTAKSRNISLLNTGNTAFFDEILYNKKYGTCRGSGVVVKTTTGWRISQYNLAITIPNEIAGEISQHIKEYQQRPKEVSN